MAGDMQKTMITCKDITLRDFKESDIETRVYWETVETEWQLWDGPWEYEGLTDEERNAELERYIKNMHDWANRASNMPADKTRYSFQIETNAEHRYIGWVNSYCIDAAYEYTEDAGMCAVGIDLPERAARGHGYASQALCAFIKYLFDNGETDIYTQTWSGNVRMIGLALKLGFVECCRKPDIRTVRGAKYDGLTFRLDKAAFKSAYCDIMGESYK